MDQNKLISLKKKADDAYFNSGSPIMTDEKYDALCQQIEEYTTLEVGCLPRGDKVQLPIYMGSLTKHNADKSINNFLDKFDHKSFVVQEKLDGVSCLCVYKKSNIRLYTRGNGTVGTDITHLIKYGLKIPQYIQKNIMVRGELIMSKTTFKEKFNHEFKNIRNMVSGQLSKKDPNKTIISNLDFIAYEVIEPQLEHQKSIVEQFRLLEKNNFKVVYNRTINRSYLEQEILMDYLVRRKSKSLYEIDGLVITIDGEYERNVSDNPKYAFAFKIQGEVVEAEVDRVKWNLSKSGKYKPQIFIKPVNLSGVTISSLTGFNAKYIVDNRIVCGTILSITRSGDVIPHILGVIKNGNCGALELPQNSKWNSVDLYHNFQETPDEVVVKQMVHFFTSLKCLNCKDKTIQKFYNSGYTSVEGLIQAQVEDLSKIEGIGNKVATKLLSSIRENIKDASIHELLAALNSFGEGIGLKKIQNIDLSNPSSTSIKGLSEATIKEKILPFWDDSLNRVKNIKKMVGIDPDMIEQNTTITEGPFKDKIFVFTGFRDTSLEKHLIDLGGKVTSAISKKTTDLIIASDHQMKTSTKLLKARELGIKITIKSDLMKEVKKLQELTKQPEIEYDDYGSSEEE